MKKTHVKSAKKTRHIRKRHVFYFVLGLILGTGLLLILLLYLYRQKYQARVFPGVKIAGVSFSGYTQNQVAQHWLQKNTPFRQTSFTFSFEGQIATLSGEQLDIGYDATLSAVQVLSVGRTGYFLTDTYHLLLAAKDGIDLNPLFKWNTEVLETILAELKQAIDIEPENALFEFKAGRVTAFKAGKTGRSLDTETVKAQFADTLQQMATTSQTKSFVFNLPVLPVEPEVKTEQANEFGITELLGRGESFFRGSIPGRIHNVALAASRISGTLILPKQTFSFNETVGDISAATGYKQAYVIKSGRTVLDDGGGVCQVSTTLFRAALNSGLPIVERHAHSYRVSYYEQGGWKPGFDATVFAPNYDLKITNNTPAHILIQATPDTKNLKLTFELYGKKDGRKAEISPVRLWDNQPAPPDLYQDDPALPTGTTKQVDWAASGIKAAFDYTVRRNEEEFFKKTFYSNFVPWQAVYLRGTGPAQ